MKKQQVVLSQEPERSFCISFGPVESEVLAGIYNWNLNFQTTRSQEDYGLQKRHSHSLGWGGRRAVLREILGSSC